MWLQIDWKKKQNKKWFVSNFSLQREQTQKLIPQILHYIYYIFFQADEMEPVLFVVHFDFS